MKIGLILFWNIVIGMQNLKEVGTEGDEWNT